MFSYSLTRKDELYNDIVNLLEQKGALFDKSLAASEGPYIVQVYKSFLFLEYPFSEK